MDGWMDGRMPLPSFWRSLLHKEGRTTLGLAGLPRLLSLSLSVCLCVLARRSKQPQPQPPIQCNALPSANSATPRLTKYVCMCECECEQQQTVAMTDLRPPKLHFAHSKGLIIIRSYFSCTFGLTVLTTASRCKMPSNEPRKIELKVVWVQWSVFCSDKNPPRESEQSGFYFLRNYVTVWFVFAGSFCKLSGIS